MVLQEKRTAFHIWNKWEYLLPRWEKIYRSDNNEFLTEPSVDTLIALLLSFDRLLQFNLNPIFDELRRREVELRGLFKNGGSIVSLSDPTIIPEYDFEVLTKKEQDPRTYSVTLGSLAGVPQTIMEKFGSRGRITVVSPQHGLGIRRVYDQTDLKGENLNTYGINSALNAVASTMRVIPITETSGVGVTKNLMITPSYIVSALLGSALDSQD